MTYMMRFADEFKKEWVSLKAARQRYQRKLDALDGYEGARRDAEADAAKEVFENEVAAIHDEYNPEIAKWLKAMEEDISRDSAMPPSAEQLRLIELLKMREVLTDAEVESAAKQLSGNDLAFGALLEICNRTGQPFGAALGNHKSVARRRTDALDVLRDRANGLSVWNGGDANEASRPFYEFRANGGRTPRHSFAAAAVARMQDVGSMSTNDLIREIIKDTGVAFDDAYALG